MNRGAQVLEDVDESIGDYRHLLAVGGLDGLHGQSQNVILVQKFSYYLEKLNEAAQGSHNLFAERSIEHEMKADGFANEVAHAGRVKETLTKEEFSEGGEKVHPSIPG